MRRANSGTPIHLLYKAWQHNPYTDYGRRLLEVELAKTAEIHLDTNDDFALALIVNFQNEHLLLTRLQKIAEQINAFKPTKQPDYLTVLLMELLKYSPRMHDLLLDEKSTNPSIISLQNAYMNISPEHAIKMVERNPQRFFFLDAALQSNVQARLLAAKTPNANATLKVIQDEIKKTIDSGGGNDINPNIKSDATQVAQSLSLRNMQNSMEYFNLKAQAESLYQQKLIAAAINKAKQQNQSLRFDPQGHFIIEVTLPEDAYQDLMRQFPNNNIQDLLDIKNFKTPVLCNFDVKGMPSFEFAYIEWTNKIDQTTYNRLMNSPSRSSIIPLQEEMEMHMRLISRVLEEKIGADKQWDWQLIRENAANKINTAVAEQFSVALAQSDNGKTIDIAILNQNLDKSRPIIAPKCREFLIQSCRELYGQDFDNTYESKHHTIHAEDFEKKSATSQDYLRIDFSNQSSTRISGTPYTAHDKKTGIAIRSLHRAVYQIQNDQPIIKPLSKVSVEARVPSIAIKSVSHGESVKRVKETLAENYALLQKQLGDYDGPMVYNLLTSLHSKLYDNIADRNNRQRASASRILKGSHAFNSQQVQDGKPNSLWYVQNIAVNQHTKNLSYHSWDDATAEATLMSEIAMLSTFNQNGDNLSPPLRGVIENTYREVHEAYVQFLKTHTQGNIYFKDSQEGKQVIKQLEHFKEMLRAASGLHKGKNIALPKDDIERNLSANEDASLVELATKALIKIMALNKHWDKQYGMLVQSLSVFIELASQSGCKSANERYINLSGRVHLLNILNETGAQVDETKSVINALQHFVNSDITHPAGLQRALDIAYNKHNLYGAATAITEEDQGAGSKVQKTAEGDSGVIKESNTNVAETGFVSYLFQKFPKKMQPHKTNFAKATHATFIAEQSKPKKNSR